jgi:hypothetical protein
MWSAQRFEWHCDAYLTVRLAAELVRGDLDAVQIQAGNLRQAPVITTVRP